MKGMRCGAAAFVLSAGLTLAACGAEGGNGGGSAPSSTASSTGTVSDGLVGLAPALCDAVRQARAGDAVAARATFFDQAHEAVHELARRLEEVDRGRAAAVLEAKQRVEADLESQPTKPALGPDLDALAEQVSVSLARLEVPASPCAK